MGKWTVSSFRAADPSHGRARPGIETEHTDDVDSATRTAQVRTRRGDQQVSVTAPDGSGYTSR